MLCLCENNERKKRNNFCFKFKKKSEGDLRIFLRKISTRCTLKIHFTFAHCCKQMHFSCIICVVFFMFLFYVLCCLLYAFITLCQNAPAKWFCWNRNLLYQGFFPLKSITGWNIECKNKSDLNKRREKVHYFPS